jgi:uncharacterized linocin/CFP29 family protein
LYIVFAPLVFKNSDVRYQIGEDINVRYQIAKDINVRYQIAEDINVRYQIAEDINVRYQIAEDINPNVDKRGFDLFVILGFSLLGSNVFCKKLAFCNFECTFRNTV